jgi:hypothetical protein
MAANIPFWILKDNKNSEGTDALRNNHNSANAKTGSSINSSPDHAIQSPSKERFPEFIRHLSMAENVPY